MVLTRFSQLRVAFTWLPALFLLASVTPTSAEIGVTPLRHVLTPERATISVIVSNPSPRRLEARLRWIDLEARENGYRPAPPGLRGKISAAPYLTVKPANLSLEPGGRITVTVAVKPGVLFPTGEKRSHLLVESSAVRSPIHDAGGGMQTDIGLGVSTPVIMRARQEAAAAQFSDTRLRRDDAGFLAVETTLSKAGDTSSYGAVRAFFYPENSAAEQELGALMNVAVYPEINRRRVVIGLGVESLRAGVLNLVYEGRDEYHGELIANRSYQVAAP